VQGVFTFNAARLTPTQMAGVRAQLELTSEQRADYDARAADLSSEESLSVWLRSNKITTSVRTLLNAVPRSTRELELEDSDSDSDDERKEEPEELDLGSLDMGSSSDEDPGSTRATSSGPAPTGALSRQLPGIRNFPATLPRKSLTPQKAKPKSRPKRMSPDEREAFLEAFTARMDEVYKKLGPSKEKRSDELTGGTRDQRDFTRITWVLAQLKASRVCVASLLSGNKFILYANTIDDDLAADFKGLEAALSDDNLRAELLEKVQKASVKELRGREAQEAHGEARRKRAERRFNKAMRLLKRIQSVIGGVEQHDPRTDDKHAEMRGADAAATLLGGSSVASGSGSHDMVPPGTISNNNNNNSAPSPSVDTPSSAPVLGIPVDPGASSVQGPLPQPQSLRGFVAISKLCCGKCTLALMALREVLEIDFIVQGSHMKTYDTGTGWPTPAFLLNNPEAMQHFLGDKAYALYQDYPEEARKLIETEKLANKSYLQTEYVSSEDELSDEEL
jgi:hypothetical protein